MLNIKKILLVAVCAVTAACALAAVRLVDGKTREPLGLASIADRNGNLVGMTDKNGVIPDLTAASFPVTFSYMGYEPLEVATIADGDVAMTEAIYELPEIEVSPGAHPLLHITGYMREHSTALGSPDSVVLLSESIVDFLIPVEKTKEKGWRKPRFLASKMYSRFKNGNGLDSVGNQVDELYLWAKNMDIFPSSKSTIEIPEKITAASGFSADTVVLKNKSTMYWQRNDDVVRLSHDYLTAYDNHVFSPAPLKILGMTTDMSEMTQNFVFRPGDATELKAADVSQLSLSLKMLGKGKLWKWVCRSKTPVDVTDYIELYVIDREYLTEAEAKELKKNPPAVAVTEVVAPKGAAPLHPGVQAIVDRVNASQK